MVMPGRSYTAGTGYRYGFNGKEMDNETYGKGNEYDYGFRIYNPRIGRFLSVDPLSFKYPSYTPYQFAGNTPIQAVDLDGLEPFIPPSAYDGGGMIGMKGAANITKRFLKGIIKAPIVAFGTLTEIVGREEYGNRIKNPDPATDFPLIGNKNYIDIAKGVIASPAILLAALNKDPDNPTLWGEAVALIGGVGVLESYITAPAKMDIAFGLNEPIPGGQGVRTLREFSRTRRAFQHEEWENVFGSLRENNLKTYFIKLLITQFKMVQKLNLTLVKLILLVL
jgi:RHS repeat-associated protein